MQPPARFLIGNVWCGIRAAQGHADVAQAPGELSEYLVVLEPREAGGVDANGAHGRVWPLAPQIEIQVPAAEESLSFAPEAAHLEWDPPLQGRGLLRFTWGLMTNVW